jgi:Putative periplasmic protein kinase ArgK and related GTPases of G3E family
LETVGAGQTDIEISRLADLVMVLVMPELGDEIQALKAGILEIADLIILNKADLPNAQQSYIKYRLTIPKEIPMFKISALNNEGITQLVDYIMQRIKEGNFNVSRKKERIKDSLIKLTSLQLVYEIMKFLPETILTDFIDNILNRNITLDDASQDLAKLIKEKYLKI